MLKVAKQDRVLGDPDWRLVQELGDLKAPGTLQRQNSLAQENTASQSLNATTGEPT